MMRPNMRRIASTERLFQTFHKQRHRFQIPFDGSKLRFTHIPNELWGAASLFLNLYTTKHQHCKPKSTLFRSSSHVSSASLETTLPQPPSFPSTITDALDYTPKLSTREETLCFAFSTILCCIIFIFTAPTSFSTSYASSMTLLCAFFFACARYLLLERHYSRTVMMSESELAHRCSPSKSKFLTIQGLALHYTISTPYNNNNDNNDNNNSNNDNGDVIVMNTTTTNTTTKSTPSHYLHCLHGFGASTYSWSFIQDTLSSSINAIVTAHDLPGFGLSQRSSDVKYYSLQFNGEVAHAIVDHVRNNHSSSNDSSSNNSTMIGNDDMNNSNTNNSNSNNSSSQSQSLSSNNNNKYWLIGHSMGAAAAAESVIQHPQSIAGLILVAPAIVALWMGIPQSAKGDVIARGVAYMEEMVMAEDPPGEVVIVDDNGNSSDGNNNKISSNKQSNTTTNNTNNTNDINNNNGQEYKKLARIATSLIQSFFSEIARGILLLSTPFMIILLRKLVRTRSFWERGLSAAWSDKTRVTAEYVNSYRLCMLVHGWEQGILRFLSARFSEKSNILHAMSSIFENEGHLTQAERLSRVIHEYNIPVLIVHGKNDALVPVGNSRRLEKILPGSTKLVEFDLTGHMPHEERSDEFVEVVASFVREQQQQQQSSNGI